MRCVALDTLYEGALVFISVFAGRVDWQHRSQPPVCSWQREAAKPLLVLFKETNEESEVD